MKGLNDFELPIAAGLAGFIFSICLFTCGETKDGNSLFREVKVEDVKPSVEQVIGDKIAFLTGRIKQFEDSLGAVCDTEDKLKNTNCTKLASLISKYNEEKSGLEKRLYNIKHHIHDTLPLYYTGYFSMSADTLGNVLQNFKNDTTFVANVLDNSNLSTPGKSYTFKLKSKAAATKVKFINRNPVLGFWIVLSIGQMTMWFLISFLLIGWARSIVQTFDWGSFLKSSILPTMAVALFAFLFYYSLADEYLFSPNMILSGFYSKMAWYAIPGYIAAAICFGIYIYAASQLRMLNTALLSSPLNSPMSLEEFEKTKKLFNTAFLTSAMILSLFTLWIAILFAGINQMEIARFYRHLSGKEFLNGDLIYMVALLHTILLLLFYVPIKLKFNSLEINQAANRAQPPGPQKWFTFLSKSMGTLLITTSPLITGLIERVISDLLQ